MGPIVASPQPPRLAKAPKTADHPPVQSQSISGCPEHCLPSSCPPPPAPCSRSLPHLTPRLAPPAPPHTPLGLAETHRPSEPGPVPPMSLPSQLLLPHPNTPSPGVRPKPRPGTLPPSSRAAPRSASPLPPLSPASWHHQPVCSILGQMSLTPTFPPAPLPNLRPRLSHQALFRSLHTSGSKAPNSCCQHCLPKHCFTRSTFCGSLGPVRSSLNLLGWLTRSSRPAPMPLTMS